MINKLYLSFINKQKNKKAKEHFQIVLKKRKQKINNLIVKNIPIIIILFYLSQNFWNRCKIIENPNTIA